MPWEARTLDMHGTNERNAVMTRRQEVILAGLTVLLLAVATGPQVAADVITIDVGGFTLLAGEKVDLGRGTSVTGAIGAGKKITAKDDNTLGGLYSEDEISLGKRTVVRGRVLANKKAKAGERLDYKGVSWTGKDVEFKREAIIFGDVVASTGEIKIERDALITGNVLGNRNISIKHDSLITGDVSPGLGYSLSTERDVTITGSTDPGPVLADTFALPQIGPAPARDPYGSENVDAGKKSTTTLTPGAYRDLDFDDEAVVTLSAGTYDIRDFSMKNKGLVDIDAAAGDVVINADAFKAGNDLRVTILGQGRFTVNVYSSKGVWIGKDSYVEARFHAYGGNVRAGDRATFEGIMLTTEDIVIGKNSAISLIQAIAVPEPGAAIMLAVGGILVIWRRRLRVKPNTSA